MVAEAGALRADWKHMKFAVVVFPGLQLRSRRVSRGEARARPGRRVRLAQGHRACRAPTWSSCPAGSRTATTCAPARSRASRRSWRRSTEFAGAGGPVLGICNGFQILLEAGLLPGAMLRNRDLKFHCEHVCVRVEQTDTPFTGARRPARCCACRSRTARATTTPTPDVAAAARSERQVVFRYCDAARRGHRRRQPERRRVNNIAGICNEAPQRRRPDAAPRARVRAGARQRGRARAVRVGRSASLQRGESASATA